MREFVGQFYPGNGSVQNVFCVAVSADRARDIFNAQYGRGKVTNVMSCGAAGIRSR